MRCYYTFAASAARRPLSQDRAAVITQVILQICDGPCSNVPGAITALLRDEFHDIQRVTRDDIRLQDE